MVYFASNYNNNLELETPESVFCSQPQEQTEEKSSEFKAKVAIEALKETSTLSELSKKYEIAPEVISRWKSELLKNAGTVFSV